MILFTYLNKNDHIILKIKDVMISLAQACHYVRKKMNVHVYCGYLS